ncbi:E3 ubiquitin-protein ligase TRIM35-like [Garra rufa]|uniref:E3 ubiquitin-protein ligase TRIM35-like n=1 Tax=Garra rufa TaxID=137080 RepID=UPI003CCEF2FA
MLLRHCVTSSQAQRTERKIREEFNKLQQFLKKEEESRIAALNEEQKEKRGKMKRKMRSISDRLREVEERMKDDDVSFLQIQNWEKMKDICPYYPVILDPNAAPPDVFISNDLTSVTSCVQRQDEHNPLPLHTNHLVLGTVGYSSGSQTWDIEVGNSRHWSLGVCLGSEERSIVQMLNPADGFWGLRRDGDVYRFLKISATFKLKTNPQVVRVTLGDCYDKKGVWWRNVIFSDATCNSPFAYFHLPAGMELFPFVIPEKRSGPLRIVPAKVTVTIEQVEEERSLPERHRDSPKKPKAV